jgi:hypothetical protein
MTAPVPSPILLSSSTSPRRSQSPYSDATFRFSRANVSTIRLKPRPLSSVARKFLREGSYSPIQGFSRIAQQHSSDGAVSQPVAGVTGDDEDVLFVTGIAADEGQADHAIEDLAGPAKFGGPDIREIFPGPVCEASVLVGIRASLTRFVVLAADDQEIFRVATVVNLLGTHVVERLGRVPVGGMAEKDFPRWPCRLRRFDMRPAWCAFSPSRSPEYWWRR